MKRVTYIVLSFVFGLSFLSVSSVHADSGDMHEDFSVAQQLIAEKVSCDQLTEDQLEMIGDYYMEQIHPGEQHEFMDNMMGGEGSESLRAVHIQIAESAYCGAGFTTTTRQFFGGGMMGGIGMMKYPYANDNAMWTKVNSNGWNMPMMGYGNYGTHAYSAWYMVCLILGTLFLLTGIAAFVKYLMKK